MHKPTRGAVTYIHTYIRTYVVAYMHLHRQPVLAWKKDGLPVVSEWVVEA